AAEQALGVRVVRAGIDRERVLVALGRERAVVERDADVRDVLPGRELELHVREAREELLDAVLDRLDGRRVVLGACELEGLRVVAERVDDVAALRLAVREVQARAEVLLERERL